MKSDVKRGRIRRRRRRRRCLGTKRVLRDRVDLHLGATCKLSKRKREKERQAKKYQSTTISKERKEWYVCVRTYVI